jgi:DDE family transposase
LQIVYGLLCAPDGCPVAIEVFDGNTGDPKTLAPQIEKLKQRFHLDRVVLVGDRGMITEARVTEDLKSAGLDWITALRAPAIKELLTAPRTQLAGGRIDRRVDRARFRSTAVSMACAENAANFGLERRRVRQVKAAPSPCPNASAASYSCAWPRSV